MQPDRPRRAWVLNLDAEHELEAQGSYAPTRRLADIVARQSQHLLGGLVPAGDLVVDAREGVPGSGAERWRVREVGADGEALVRRVDRSELEGLELATWLPTPTAARLVRGSGLVAPPVPALEVLRQVNARPFAVAARASLVEPAAAPGADRDSGRDWDDAAHPAFAKHVALDLEAVLERLAAPAPLGWLVRRTFGAAGRGRRRLNSGPPTAAELAWLVASLAKGPLVIEPWVEVTAEFTRSGLVRVDGSVDLSGPCFQETTTTGAWTRTARAGAGEVARADDDELGRAVEAAGQALASAGYHGPFGIDAFRYRDPSNASRTILNPMSEINARYTMDWALAMGAAHDEG